MRRTVHLLIAGGVALAATFAGASQAATATTG